MSVRRTLPLGPLPARRWILVVASLLVFVGAASAHPQQQQVGRAVVSAPTPGAAPVVPKKATTTAIRRFLAQKNRILVTREAAQESISLKPGTLTVAGIGAFEPGRESERLLGLRVVVDSPQLKESERVHYLDLHEVESLLRGLPALREVAAEGGRGFPTHAVQKSVEGFGVAITVDGRRTQYWVMAGKNSRQRLAISETGFLQVQNRVAAALDGLFNASE